MHSWSVVPVLLQSILILAGKKSRYGPSPHLLLFMPSSFLSPYERNGPAQCGESVQDSFTSVFDELRLCLHLFRNFSHLKGKFLSSTDDILEQREVLGRIKRKNKGLHLHGRFTVGFSPHFPLSEKKHEGKATCTGILRTLCFQSIGI